ncbi:MAG TPA: hypothetical protein VF228_19295 [Iamia sp.]
MAAPTFAVPPATATTAPAATRAAADDQALGALLAGAGLVHVAMAPAHLAASTSDGVGFLVAGAVQLVVAVLVVARPSRGTSALAAGVSAIALGAWAVSRTAGLPYGAHEGVAEPIAFVDGATAALAAFALLGAVIRFARPSGRRSADGDGFVDPTGPILLRGLAVGALALSIAAIASPSAREHGHGAEEAGGGGHGHGPAAEGVDDLGYSALVNGQMGSHEHPDGPGAEPTLTPAESGALAEQVAWTAPLVELYPTVADAKAAGYKQQGPFSPGLGVHFSGPGTSYNSDGDMDTEDVQSGMLIYDGVEDDARLAGFMYMALQDEPPEGFVGDLDTWHYHTAVCIVVTPDGIDTPFGADLSGVTKEMCEAEGGSLLDFTGYMVHLWTVPGYESPEGLFSDLNPAITCPDGTYYTIPIREIGAADSTCRNA